MKTKVMIVGCALMVLMGCSTGPEKAILAFVGEKACDNRNAALDTKEDEPLIAQGPTCPQKHNVLEQEACKKLQANGPCVVHARETVEGSDLIDYCLVKSGDSFKIDGGCTAAGALVRAYYAAQDCAARAPFIFAPGENSRQLALLASRNPSCRAPVKSIDLSECQGTLHAKEGRCIVKATVGDTTTEVCVRRDADKLSVDLRCTEMLDGLDGIRITMSPTNDYDTNHSEKEFVSKSVMTSGSLTAKKIWLKRDSTVPGLAKLRAATQSSKIIARGDIVKDRFTLFASIDDGWWQLPPKTNCPAGMQLVPARGDPTASADIAPFCVDSTEVTVAAYDACVTAGGCTKAGAGGACNEGVQGRENHPINCVNWSQSMSYCAQAGKWLATAQEWEQAALGPDGRKYPWGNAEPDEQLCWTNVGAAGHGFKRSSTCPVGSFPTGNSPFGLADMVGNVAEWTSTLSSDSEGNQRANRGGSWYDVYPSKEHAAFHYGDNPSLQINNLGFRCSR